MSSPRQVMLREAGNFLVGLRHHGVPLTDPEDKVLHDIWRTVGYWQCWGLFWFHHPQHGKECVEFFKRICSEEIKKLNNVLQ